MGDAAAADIAARKRKQPGINKLKMLDEVFDLLSKRSWQLPLLDAGVLRALREWLHPSRDGSLPNMKLRSRLYEVLDRLPGESSHSLWPL